MDADRFRVTRVRIVSALMVCAVAVGSSIGSADAATTTKKKVAPTTKVRKPTEYDRRIAALKDLYARFVALDEKRLSNKTDVAIVPVEGKTILVGTAYNGMVINEKSDLAQGIYYGPLAIESLNLRVESSSATAAIMRVCQRYSTVSPKYKKDDTVAPGPVTYVTDLQISTVYSAKAKRWFISEYPHFEDVEGQSKCADGK